MRTVALMAEFASTQCSVPFIFLPALTSPVLESGSYSQLSLIHIFIQREEYGGGEIYFDDALIRKDGIFVLDELKCLNPENLK